MPLLFDSNLQTEMDKKLDRDEVIRNFSKRALEGKGLGAVLEMGAEHANVYRNYVTNRLIKKHLELKSSDVVLDFGCGLGRVARFLSKHCKRVEAVDGSAEMISRAEKDFTNPTNINYQLVSTKALPFADNSIDKIFTFWVLQHFGDDLVEETMKEFARVLKPGGKIILFEQTIPVTMVWEGWSIHRNTEEYSEFGKRVGLKLVYNERVIKNPSRGMSLWLRFGKKKPWLLPLLYRFDSMTVNRKTEFAYYFTSAVAFTR